MSDNLRNYCCAISQISRFIEVGSDEVDRLCIANNVSSDICEQLLRTKIHYDEISQRAWEIALRLDEEADHLAQLQVDCIDNMLRPGSDATSIRRMKNCKIFFDSVFKEIERQNDGMYQSFREYRDALHGVIDKDARKLIEAIKSNKDEEQYCKYNLDSEFYHVYELNME